MLIIANIASKKYCNINNISNQLGKLAHLLHWSDSHDLPKEK